MRRLFGALALVLAALSGGRAVSAEMVRHEVGDLVLEAPPALERDAERLARAARRIVPELERDLGVRARGPYRIVLVPASRPLDAELERIDALAPSWAAGFLAGSLRLGAIRMDAVTRYPYDGAEEVLAHEIVHMLLYDASRHPLPAWFSEGVATFEGRRRGIRDLVVSATVVLMRDPPTLDEIDAMFRAGPSSTRHAYAASQDFVAWSVRRYGHEVVPRVVAQLADLPIDEAWRIASGDDLEDSERAWRRRSVWMHRIIPALASTSTLWLLITLLAVLAGLARQRRDREIRARWEAEDAGAAPPAGEEDVVH